MRVTLPSLLRIVSRTLNTMSEMSQLKIGLCQMPVTSDKMKNIAVAREHIEQACGMGSELVMLPEIWNGPYASVLFAEYAETVPSVGDVAEEVKSPSVHMLTASAKEYGVWLVGGSVSERAADGKIYNTCVVVNPDGKIVGKHRKMHLFDIDVQKPKKMYFKESQTLTGGDSFTVVDTPWGKVGVGICYDIRFPDMAIAMRQAGARLLVYPAAFNMVTGPAHWELLARARAMDNQVFVALCSPACVTEEEGNTGYVAYGHSTVVDPWGEVRADLGTGARVQVVECNLDRIDEVRASLPYWQQKRLDMYSSVKMRD